MSDTQFRTHSTVSLYETKQYGTGNSDKLNDLVAQSLHKNVGYYTSTVGTDMYDKNFIELDTAARFHKIFRVL